MNPCKIAVGITSVDHKIHWGIVASLFKMLTDGRYAGVEFEPIFETGIYIDEIRNRIGMKFLNGDADFLFYLDYDNGLPVDWLDCFMEDFENPEVMIVSGAYHFKNNTGTMVAGIHPPHLPKGVYMWLSKESYTTDLVNVSKASGSDGAVVGAGCLMIRRKALSVIPYPWFTTQYGTAEGGIMFWGEDTGFCENAGKAGLDIYLDQRIKSPHMAGDKCYPEEWRQLPKGGIPQTTNLPTGVKYEA